MELEPDIATNKITADIISCIFSVPFKCSRKILKRFSKKRLYRKIILLFKTMRLVCRKSLLVGGDRTYLFLSSIKSVRTGKFSLEKLLLHPTAAFVRIYNKGTFKYECIVCEVPMKTNHRIQHIRKNCKIVKNTNLVKICEICKEYEFTHPKSDSDRIRFCPLELLNCRTCESNILAAEYYIYHADACPNITDKKCMWCLKLFKRGEIKNHELSCGSINIHFSACGTDKSIMSCENMVGHLELCRSKNIERMLKVINKWKSVIVSHYMKVYENLVLCKFIKLLEYKRFGPLFTLSMAMEQPTLFNKEPMSINEDPVIEFIDVDVSYEKLSKYGFMESELFLEEYISTNIIGSSDLFYIKVNGFVFSFWIKCCFNLHDNGMASLSLTHIRADYRDDDLNYIVQDVLNMGGFKVFYVIIKDA